MKAQFKYAFLTGLQLRGIVFAVIFTMNLIFILLGMMDLLPFAAQITAVSLAGTAIGVMAIVNVINDIAIIRRMFVAPGAYIYALTPVPRTKTLSASVIAMFVKDTVTMFFAIIGVSILSIMLSSNYIGEIPWAIMMDSIRTNLSDILFGLWFVALGIAMYFLIIMIIVFCMTARKSFLFQIPAGGFIAVLLAGVTVYASNLMLFLLAPLGTVSRWGIFFSVSVGRGGLIAYVILILLQAAALFIVTTRLMERKMNI